MDSLLSLFGGAVTGAVFYLGYSHLMESRKEKRTRHNLAVAPDVDHMASKTFTIRDALNGQYIMFHRHKYNPNGPDINEQCVYIVKDNETLIDAISVVLVLMNKEN